MQTFIDTLATAATKSPNLSACTYVFPNRRAGLFFTRALTNLTSEGPAVILPHVTDINRFVEEHSSLRRADDTELLIWLLRAYTLVDSPDTPHQLKSFIELGTKILHDFNEIDKYLVDPETLFRNINDLSGLTANIDEDIQRFYNTLLTKSDDTPLLFHQRFSSLWNIMFPLYQTFRSLLRSHGIAYEGMLFRDICNTEDESLFHIPIVFAGFNILTESEKRFIERFPNRSMVFDYNSLSRTDTDFDYRSVNIRDFAFSIPSSVIAHPCMTSAEQGYSLRHAMQSIATNNPDIENNTAIILADESLLIEALSNLKDIKHLNITMGYPLANTQIANFVNLVIRMQISMQTDSDGILKIYHKPLLDLLSHPYFKLICPDDTSAIIHHIRTNNLSRIPLTTIHSFLENQPSLISLFSRNTEPFSYLLYTLDLLRQSIDPDRNPTSDTEAIDHHFIRQYTSRIASLKDYLASAGITADEPETYALIRRLTRSMKVQFRGEPLQGLQVMGLLECRLLDFDNIIFLGFNDQFVPGTGSTNNSIIPYSLRKPYGLPSHEITNSIYAYNFYRMLHRCSRLDLIYATATNEDSKSEVSRFYNQLLYIHGCSIADGNANTESTINPTSNLFTPYFEQSLTPLTVHQLSATALKRFITCPLSFYYEYILNIRRQDSVDDTISDSLFGNLLHKSLELYYKTARENHILTQQQISTLTDQVCEQAYAQVIRQRHNRGYDILAYNSLHTIVSRIIRFDESRPKFYDVQTETPFSVTIDNFHIKAFVDRIDRQQTGEHIVIDYKTSLDVSTASLDRMFSSDLATKYDLEVMQVLLYCAILHRDNRYAHSPLFPQLFKVYSLVSDTANKALTPITIDVDGTKTAITDYEIIREKFEARLSGILSDLRNSLATPQLFLRTATKPEHCQYCPFHDLCLKQ